MFLPLARAGAFKVFIAGAFLEAALGAIGAGFGLVSSSPPALEELLLDDEHLDDMLLLEFSSESLCSGPSSPLSSHDCGDVRGFFSRSALRLGAGTAVGSAHSSSSAWTPPATFCRIDLSSPNCAGRQLPRRQSP